MNELGDTELPDTTAGVGQRGVGLRVRAVLSVLRTAVVNPELRRLGSAYALCCTAELGIWIAS